MRKGNSENTDQGRPKLIATTMGDTPTIYQKSDNPLKHHQAQLAMAKSQSKNYLVKLKRTSSWRSLLRLCWMEGNGNQLLFFDFVPSLGAMIVSSCFFQYITMVSTAVAWTSKATKARDGHEDTHDNLIFKIPGKNKSNLMPRDHFTTKNELREIDHSLVMDAN